MAIAYGNLEGRYFTQWRINDLLDLWRSLNEPTQLARDSLIWYDADEDYHMLEFFVGQQHVKIRRAA